jgi:hypothetical protein
MGKDLENEAVAAQRNSTLPEAVNLNEITNLITEVYLSFWNA